MTLPILRTATLAPLAAMLCLVPGLGHAFEFNTGDEEFKLRWDNTVKYSNAFRVRHADAQLLDNINGDDGDRNFSRGLISNRFDLLSELDASYRNVGFRISGAAWYDDVYQHDNDNNSPSTNNASSVPHDHFSSETRDLHGQKAELLDAYVYGKGTFRDMDVLGRVGRHTLLWGESLFYASNGIAAGQAPIDAVKAASVPNTPAKELFMPVNQLSGQLQVNDMLTLAAYYQLEWRRNRLPGAGSYFSAADILDIGGERLLVGPGAAFYRGSDKQASDSGQGGVSVRIRPGDGDFEFGLYALRYHDKNPQVYLRPALAANGALIAPELLDPGIGKIGEYGLLYGEGIKMYGASFSTVLLGANVAGEASVRRDTPLVSLAGPLPPVGHGNVPYAIGNSAHAQVSAIYSLPPNFLSQSAMLSTELAWNRMTSVTRNSAALDPTRDRDAWGMRTVFEPQYLRVIPNWDLSVPMGVGFTHGNSAVDPAFGPDRGGDLSLGLNATYKQVWKFTSNYTHYYGPESSQLLRDRDFVAFSVRRTF